MAGIFDIGASGLAASRAALTVTGENIANADTDGYHRRNVISESLPGRASSPTTKAPIANGVGISEVRRAFDGLLAARERVANGAAQAAETAQPYLEALEQRLMPEGGGVGPKLGAWFEAIGTLASAPDDPGFRSIVLSAGDGLAAGVRDLARGLGELVSGVTEEAVMGIDRANTILVDLAELQKDLLASQGSGTANAILDRRDALLGELGGITSIHVTPEDGGRVSVTLGSDPGGPLLLKGGKHGALSSTDPDRITAIPVDGGSPQTRRVDTGLLQGISDALGAIGAAQDALDTWAQGIAEDMNFVHASGLRQDGNPGDEMFSLRGWQVSPMAASAGRISADTEITDPALMPAGPLTVVRDTGAGLWRVNDASGTELANGATEITLPGLVIRPGGDARNGDRMLLSLREGSALDLAFMPASGAELATASTNAAAVGDPTIAERIADLASRDAMSGRGGYSAEYAEILADAGSTVSAGRDRVLSTTARLESAQSTIAAASSVDLDTEAADLLRHQQAYQANAQVLNVARQLFDTLLNAV